jgi:NTP pyrophosphatase (non-canonical NTP hydrolase)
MKKSRVTLGGEKKDWKILEKGLDLLGKERQRECAIEECAELIVGLQHDKRERASEDEVLEEVADVFIMMRQLSLELGEQKVAKKIKQKMKKYEAQLKDLEQAKVMI